MIALLTGIPIHFANNLVTLDVNGVGYEVVCSKSCLENLHLEKVEKVVIYTDVKEDAICLYGFLNYQEKQVFLLLKKVNGVGSKTASDIISRVSPLELMRAIGAGDVAKLQSIKGIGKKTAERIVVELRDLVSQGLDLPNSNLNSSIEVSSQSQSFEDAISALQALGFIRKDAEKAVNLAKQQGLAAKASTGEIVREALRFV